MGFFFGAAAGYFVVVADVGEVGVGHKPKAGGDKDEGELSEEVPAEETGHEEAILQLTSVHESCGCCKAPKYSFARMVEQEEAGLRKGADGNEAKREEEEADEALV